MAIGVSREEFYHSTLVELRDYDEIFKERRMLEDQRDYMCGIYTYEAVSIAIANAIRSKGSKPAEYRKKPIMVEVEEQRRLLNPTEEDKKKQLDQLREMLFGMQKRFEESKKAAVE